MKGLYTSLFALVFVMSFSFTNTVANENAASLTSESTLSVTIPDVVVDCDAFDCPISTTRGFRGCITVDDCSALTDEQIKRIITAFFDRACERLRYCCRVNGCDEFKCELVDYSFGCRDKTTFCVKIEVAFKCA